MPRTFKKRASDLCAYGSVSCSHGKYVFRMSVCTQLTRFLMFFAHPKSRFVCTAQQKEGRPAFSYFGKNPIFGHRCTTGTMIKTQKRREGEKQLMDGEGRRRGVWYGIVWHRGCIFGSNHSNRGLAKVHRLDI